ncbi:MAG: CHRD domain-containing protein [Betaproteobacteria bacterium]|nr:CHRD domain-containing protein [Betaproteobacteria bacterium]
MAGRTLAPAFSFSNLPTLAVPFAVSNPASTAANTTDYGSGTTDTLPLAPATGILISTLFLAPQSTANAASYTISLDPSLAVAGIDQDGACGAGASPPMDVAISASFTLIKAASPQFTSENSATFTVGFAGNFQVQVAGNPSPTLNLMGSLPIGVSFSNGSGILGGTPVLNTVGTYPLTISAANGVMPDANQSFTLIVQKANQAINFDPPANRNFSSMPFTVSATSSLGGAYPVAFSSSTMSICSVSGANVTMIAAGTCSIVASQSGDSNYNAAAVSRSFLIAPVAPAAPVIGAATAGNGSVSVAFTAPGFTGGLPISGYTATCGSQTASSATSPIAVSGLPNGVAVTCTVTATNGSFTSPSSAASNSVTPFASFTVTPSAGTNGTISPPSPVVVNQGSTTVFTVTPNAGYVASVGGTCGGSLSGNTYTTAAITGPCTVSATFTQLVTYNLVLEGAQETPPNASTGTGSGTAVIDTVNNTITLNASFAGIGALTAAHFHGPGARGVAVGVKVGLTDLTSPMTETVSYLEADEADILAGNWYLNLHTAAFPGGELRAQLDNAGTAAKTLTASVTGSGTGSVTGTGINCPGDCTESYAHNTVVSLTATPNAGSTFTGWSGACTGTGNCMVTMDFVKSVTAIFSLNSYAVTGLASPLAGGSVTCISPVNHGSTTSCTVTTNAGYTLTNISGCGGTPGMISPYMTGAITGACTVTATYNAPVSFQRAVSRKTHAAAGDRDIVLLHTEPIGGNVTTEPRQVQGGHLVVFVFDAPLIANAAPIIVDAAAMPINPVSVERNGNELRVLLPALQDGSRVSISVTGVNGAVDVSTTVGFLYGDITNSRRVTAADIASVKAWSGQTVNGSNYRADLNLSGQINGIDVSAVKARAGQVLP